LDLGGESAASTSVVRKSSLQELIAADSFLKNHIGEIPGKQGVNIEGIAVRGGDLYFGFRGPLVDDAAAIVMRVAIKAIFGTDTAVPTTDMLPLGKGQGIRDLAAVTDGLLVLSGPEARKPGKAEVFLWKPGAMPLLLADLGGPRLDEGQP